MNTEQEQYSIKLKELIAQGYKIFSVYSLDKTEALDACMCGGCSFEEDHIYLKNTPLQRIEIGIFNNYVNAAYSNQTPLCEFKYFLPLFLDFLVQGTNNFLSENYFFQRISAYSLGGWTIGELTFLQQFAETYIHYHLYQEENAEFKYIEIFLDMFQSYLFDTEKLSNLCLNHPSAYSLIDYATQKVNSGYDEYEQADELSLTSERVRKILLHWNNDQTIRQHFIDCYNAFKHQGYTFDQGNANWVRIWIEGIEQGIY
ncbi:hypothetical protein [Acinetobacter sp. 1125_18A]|uniref:hypothetical protein n=1 Tax=Acinetobacter sp. 1125_18A TaxID=2605959 RepID=UPI00405A2525